MSRTRIEAVDFAKSYLGVKQGSKRHKEIVDIFNKKSPHGEKGTYTCPWCAIFWTAIQLLAGMNAKQTPMSYNCGTLIADAKKLGCWKEDDNYLPKMGDGIIYDWSDTGYPVENKDGASHVGMVVSVSGNEIKVIEGNYSTKENVSYRTIYRNQRYIRGYIVPKYNENPEKVHKRCVELAYKKTIAKKKYKYPNGKATDAFTKQLKKHFKDRSKWGAAPKVGASCDVAVAVVVRPILTDYPRGLNQQIKYTNKDKLKVHTSKTKTPYEIIKGLGLKGTYIVQYKIDDDSKHTLIYSNKVIYEASYEKYFFHAAGLSKIKKARPYVRVLEFI